MRIQYVSDLHLELQQNASFLNINRLIPKADILVMAGDITLFYKNLDKEFYFDYLSKHFKEVYWLPGNHEYYNSDIIRYHKFHEKAIRENIHLVNNQVLSIDGINLIFTTLWGGISAKNELYIKSHVSDFSLISYDGEDFRPKHFNKLHSDSKTFLESELSKRENEKNVIITHHVPTFINYPEEFKKSPLNEAFTVELSDLIEEYSPEAWIYGHTHVNTPDFKIGKTKMLTNQLGYVEMEEHKTFRRDAIIDI